MLPSDLEKHVAHIRQAHLHVGELQLDELAARDRLAALDALVGVFGGVFEGAVGLAVVRQGHEESLEVEIRDAAHEAVAFRAKEVRLFEFDVVEVDLGARIHSEPELVQGFLCNARLAHVDEPFGVDVHVVGVAGHHHQVGNAHTGRLERLVPVEIDLAVAPRVRRAHVVPGRSRARLGHRVVEDLLARAEIGEDFLPLLVGALAHDRFKAGQLVKDVRGAAEAAEHLVHGGQRDPVEAESVVLLGKENAVESDVAQSLHPFERIGRCLVALMEVLFPRA